MENPTPKNLNAQAMLLVALLLLVVVVGFWLTDIKF